MDLDRLIATEQRLDEALRRAQQEAAALAQAAQAEAGRSEAELAAELEATARRFAAETAAERERREREVRAEAAARVARYDAVPDERIAATARDVVDWLVAGEVPAT